MRFEEAYGGAASGAGRRTSPAARPGEKLPSQTTSYRRPSPVERCMAHPVWILAMS